MRFSLAHSLTLGLTNLKMPRQRSPPQTTRWVFTINNYTDDDLQRLAGYGRDLASVDLSYLVYGREVGDSGTPHLQGYCIFVRKLRLRPVRELIGERGHFEVSRGTPAEASTYCKKGGDFFEFGDAPRAVATKSKTDVTKFCDWVKELGSMPSERTMANMFPSLWLKNRSNLVDLAGMILPPDILQEEPLNEWQTTLLGTLEGEADDRSVMFYVDPAGGNGKSFFCRYMLTLHDEDTQVLSIGKLADLAYAIDRTKRLFLFNIPRGGMEYLQYTILEQLKDRVVFSPKYQSNTKVITRKCHVVVFCNEHPDMEKMTDDRYKITTL
ncbi:MAG: putative viral replication protein [Persevirus pargotis]|uniref:Viral replication protein n=1 Tax=Cressdnaviricota sp. TaxID=2748378 RepID=A0A385E704_9VIRU|nr:MAG: putative viral replication protein [Cressdnaviricota sp.]